VDVRRQRAAGPQLGQGQAGVHRSARVIDERRLAVLTAVPLEDRRRLKRAVVEMSKEMHDVVSLSAGTGPLTLTRWKSIRSPMSLPGARPFNVIETHGRAVRPENELLAHSQDLGWRSLHAAIFKEAPLDVREPAVRHPFIIYHMTHPTEVRRTIEGARPEQRLLGPRNICVTPPDTVTEWRHCGHPQILQVYIRRSVYESAVAEMFGSDAEAAEVVPRFGVSDPLLEQLALTLIDALRTGAIRDGLYIDTVAQMVAVHLARTHSVQSRPGRVPPVATVSHQRMRHLIEFIEANLHDHLTLDAMAAQVGISPLYLARAFKAAVGQSPHQYVLMRRIERAKELLRTTDMPIVDVALSVGFSSQSHLSHWMIRHTGVSPAAYRRGEP